MDMSTATVAQHLELQLGYDESQSSPLTELAHLDFINDVESSNGLLVEDASGGEAVHQQSGPPSFTQQPEQSQQSMAAIAHFEETSPSCSPFAQPYPSFSLQPSFLSQAQAHLQLDHQECAMNEGLHHLHSHSQTLDMSQEQALFHYHADMSDSLRRTSTCSGSSGTSGTSGTAFSMQPSQTSCYSDCEGTPTYFSQSPSPPALEYAQSPYRFQAAIRPVYYHTPGIARYGCTFYDCDWATDRRDLLRQHLEHHARQAIFNCPMQGCYKHFAILENLEAHQFEEHPTPLQSSHSLTHLHYASPTTHLQYLPHDAPEYSSYTDSHAHFLPAGNTVGLGLTHDLHFQELSLGVSPGSIVSSHQPQLQMVQPALPVQHHHFGRRSSDTDIYYSQLGAGSSSMEPGMPTVYEEETFVSPVQQHSSSAPPALPIYPHLISPPATVREEYYMYVPASAQESAPVPVYQPTSAAHVQFSERMFGNSPPIGTPVLSPNFSQPGSSLGEPLNLQCNMDGYVASSMHEHAPETKASPLLDATFSPLRNTTKARLTRASLARRGSEASYLASHPRFAAHPYAISSNYTEPPSVQGSSELPNKASSPRPVAAKPRVAAIKTTRLMPGPKPSISIMPRRKSVSATSPIHDVAGNVKLHPCEFEGCDRAFKRYEHKKRHERSHTLEKPYGCDVIGCGRFFSRSDNLTQHKRTHKRNGRTQRLTQANLKYAQDGVIPEDDDYEEDM